MAEMNLPLSRSAPRRIGAAAINAPRLVMSWEDWLTFAATLVTFLSVAVSMENANWVKNMPAFVPTAMLALLIGMVAARVRLPAAAIHPIALTVGAVVVVLVAQTYADGATLQERLADFRLRMGEWFDVVRSGDISNDNLPFVTLVQSVCFLSAYMAAWSLYRWRNAWVAVVPAAIVLLVNISFQRGHPSAAFITFLFGAVLLVGRVHIQRAQDLWKRDGIDYPEFMSLNAGQLTVLMTAALIVAAWWVPLGAQADAATGVSDWVAQPFTGNTGMFARLFHNIDSRKGGNLHNFDDFLPIQGNVKLGTRTLMEVNSGEAGLIRGASYDTYTGTGWLATNRKDENVNGKELAADEKATAYEARNVTILKVKVIDGFDTLLTAGTPLGTNVPSKVTKDKAFDGDIEQLRARRGFNEDDTYNTFGTESTASADQLKAAGKTYPDWVTERYLQLPKDLPARVADEAKRVVGAAPTPYAQAQQIEEYLRSFPYDLDVESAPPKRDTVDFLLFDLKRGYFDYQATAMAVMLRTLGIPARVAVGYYLDPGSATDTKYQVKKSDAYSWVEVFFPKYGWVNFNPTQDRPSGGAGGLGAGVTGPSSDPNEPDLNDLFQNPEAGPPEAVAQALNETPIENSSPPWMLIWTLAGVLAVAATGYLGTRWAWNWGLGGLDTRARLWAKSQRLAGWAKLGPHHAETPREWSRRIGGAISAEDEAKRLAAAFEEARYGRPDLQRIDDSEASGAYLKVRNALAAKIFGRRRKK